MVDRESVGSISTWEAATRVADMITTYAERMRDEGNPLTQVQLAKLIETALVAFDGYRRDVESMLEVEAALRASKTKEVSS